MADALELSRELLEASRSSAEDNRELAAGLRQVDPLELGDAARIAFWVNLYNARLLQELGERPRRGSVLRHRGLFRSSSYRVGAHDYSLDVIEHGVLRLNARPPARLRRSLSRRDPRLAAAPSRLDPRVHFALNCGAVSCPPVLPYDELGLDGQLARVSAAYLAGESRIDRDREQITLPYLMRLYRADFGSRKQQVAFAAAHLPDSDSTWLRERPDIRVSYGRFNWTLAS